MLAPLFRLAVLGSALLLAAPAWSATIYSVDDGGSEIALGQGASGDLLWGNYFFTQAGGELITDIETVFGNTGVAVGRSFTALLFDDLDNDGDPTTGLSLLTSVVGSVQNPQAVGANVFETIDIVDTLVSGGFFVAIFMDGTGNPFPSLFDQGTNSGQSFFAEHSTNGGLDVNDPFGSATLSGEPGNFGFPGNFMVRANAVLPEPDPATLLGLGLGLLGLTASGRRRS